MDPRLLLVLLLVFASAALFGMFALQRWGSGLLEVLGDYREKMGLRLRRTRNPYSTEEFSRTQLILTSVMGLLGLLLGDGAGGKVFLAALFAGAAWVGCERYLDVLWRRYLKDFEEQLPDMVGVMANAVKSGNSVQQALELVTNEFSPPMASEVGEVLQEIRVGVGLDQAMRAWIQRIPNDDLEIVCTAVIIQRQTGGNLAEILENLAMTMRERKKIQGQIRTLTTQGRMSGTIMSFLPVGLYIILYLLMPERMGILFSHPFGWGIIALCAVMIGVGSFVISRIVAIEV